MRAVLGGLITVLAACGPSARPGLVEECVVTGATLAAARTPIDDNFARAGEALIYQTPANQYSILAMPGCRVTPLVDVSERVGLGDIFILPGGTRIFATSPPGRADLTWWYAHGASNAPERIAFLPDPASPYSPILSNDGAWVAWPRIGPDRQSFRVEVVMRRPGDHSETIVALPSLDPATYDLLEVDTDAREVTLARGLREFLRLRFDGAVRWHERLEDISAQPGTFVRLGGGYFAWDAVRESGAYRIGWSLPPDRDTLAFDRLRQIQHAAIDPSGQFAAVSLETQHGRLLSLQDAVAVVRLSDRQEVFRTYLPRFTRSHVAFFASAYVAYSEADRVRVLRLPESTRR